MTIGAPARLMDRFLLNTKLGRLLFRCLCWMTIGRRSLDQFRQDEEKNGWEACNLHLRDTVTQITTIVGILSTLRVISVASTDKAVFLARIGPCRERRIFNHQPPYQNSKSGRLYYPYLLHMVLLGICNFFMGDVLPATFFPSQPVIDNGRRIDSGRGAD
jgi:hypothetical protein